MRTTLSTALLCALLIGPASHAVAQEAEDAEITRMAKEHYKLGLDAFKAGRYAEAIKELKKAYLLKRLPTLLVNIAKTYEKLGDIDNEIYYYKKYLAETPPDAKDREAMKAALADAEARKSGKSAPPPEPEAAPTPQAPTPEAPPPAATPRPVKRPPPPAETPAEAPAPAPEQTPPPVAPVAPPPAAPAVMPTEWTHTPLDAAPPGQPVDLRVQTPVMKGVKLFLYYRGKGQAEFVEVLMKRRGAEKIGRIPSSEMTGSSIQYYIEAKDASGTVVKSAGSQTDPNIVMIDAAAPPQIASRDGSPGTVEGEEGEQYVPPPEDAPPPARNIEEEDPFKKKRALQREEKLAKPKGKSDKKPVFSTLGWVGVGLAAGGAAGILVAGGGTMFGLAGKNAAAVRDYACPSASKIDMERYNNGEFGALCETPKNPDVFNDPALLSGNDFQLQEQGKLYDTLGIVFVGAGAALAVAGGAIMIADYVKNHPAPKPVKKAAPKRKKRVRKPVEEEPVEEEAAPPSDDRPEEQSRNDSPIRNFIAAPIVSPTTVGLGATFNF